MNRMSNGARVQLVAYLTIFAGGCASDGAPADGAFAVRDSAGIKIMSNVLPATLPTCELIGPVVTIGEASGREENELYRVFGARRLSDGRIVVVNQGSQELRYFDEDGTFINRAGRGGDGPGEFRNAFYLWVTDADTVWVGDYRPWQFHVFSPEGVWVRTVRPEPTYGNPPVLMAVLSGGRAVLAARDIASYGGFSPREVTAVLHDATGGIRDTVGTYQNGRYGQVGDDERSTLVYPLFESFTQLDGVGDHWYVGHGSRPEIAMFRASPGSTLERLIRWTSQDLTIRSADIDEERARLEARYTDMDPATARRLVAPLISDERPVADQFPVFNGLVANRAGGFWVREYPRPDAPGLRNWLSFDSQGRFECRVSTPDIEIVDLGRDYVLAEQSTEVGIEQVVMFELGAPSM